MFRHHMRMFEARLFANATMTWRAAAEAGRRPVRVLHFAHLINRHDFIDTIIRFSDRGRFSMAACTLTGQSNIEPPGYDRAGIPQHVIGSVSRSRYPLTVVRLARLLRTWGVEILHTHHYDGALLGVLAAKLAGTRRVVVGRHYHDELYLLATGAKLRALLAVEAFCNRQAHAIVVPSVPIQKLLAERQLVAGAKIWVVPYGFDFTAGRYSPQREGEARAALGLLGLSGCFVVGNFARHHPLKGQEYLIRAFSDLAKDFPQARLLMVGDGPHNGALRALAENLGVKHRCVFAGWRRDAVQLMAAADLVVHPTLHEAFPQVMVEALVHSKPLVISDVAGATDHIQHQRTGFLVPKRDREAIYQAMRWAIEHPDLAGSMGQRGHAYVTGNLDIRKVVGRYEACYEAVAEWRL